MLPNRLDFWNDPERWDGIADPHKEMFWMKRRVDRIDVRRPVPVPISNPYLNSPSATNALQYAALLQGQQNSYNRPSGIFGTALAGLTGLGL